jgi:hypothetical protein
MNYDENYFRKFGHLNDNIGTVCRHIDLLKKFKNTIICPAEYGLVVSHCENNFKGKFIGYDISKFAIDRKVTPNLFEGSILGLPLPDKASDLFICCDLLEHLSEKDIEIALKEIDRLTDDSRSFLVLRVFLKGMSGKGEVEDESHITMEDDEWWIDKVRENTGFVPYRYCTALGEYVFIKSRVVLDIPKETDIRAMHIRGMGHIEVVDQFCSKRKAIFTKRNDGRFQFELVEMFCGKDCLLRLISLPYDDNEELCVYHDFDGYVSACQGQGLMFSYADI